MRRLLWVVTVLLVAYAACTNANTGPAGKPETELNFVWQDSLAPPLLTKRDSVWAVVGRNAEIRMHYEHEVIPGDTGDEYLRFEVPGNGLYRKPDGTLFRPGDSVLITITVVDTARFRYEFEPAGLRFDPEHPARLKVRYFNANHDFDNDGGPDPDDDAIERLLDLWRQPAPGDLWFKLGAVKFEELDELDANILGFSKFAVAW